MLMFCDIFVLIERGCYFIDKVFVQNASVCTFLAMGTNQGQHNGANGEVFEGVVNNKVRC